MSLKSEVLRQMQAHMSKHQSSYSGKTTVDITVSRLTSLVGRTYSDVSLACWSLQKEGLLDFRQEKKGHATYLSRFRLTERGRATDPTTMSIKDRYDPGRIAADTAMGITENRIPESLVKATAFEVMRDAAPVPGAHEHGARVQPTLSPIARSKQSDNIVKPMGGTHRRHMVDLTEPSAHGSVAEGGEVTVTRDETPEVLCKATAGDGYSCQWLDGHIGGHVMGRETPASERRTDDRVHPLPSIRLHKAVEDNREYLMEGLDALTDLTSRSKRREAVNRATEALIEAGLEAMALDVMQAIPDDTLLERQVLTLMERMGLTVEPDRG